LLLGVVVIALGYFLPDAVSPMALLGIHEFHFLGVVFALLVIVMLAIGAAKPRSTPWELVSGNTIDMTPWKNAKWASLGLVVVVLAIYIAFAR
jgi:SSS family solute:Na+ symporter